MKIYTKTGDAGETGLFGGRRVSKDHLRVDAYGTIDELNSFIGFLADSIDPAHTAVRSALHQVQHRLFSIGAYLASDPDGNTALVLDLNPADLELLEKGIDDMEKQLPPLRNFILPGGHSVVSICHICRTICRRSERLVVTLNRESTVDEAVLRYLNRLSDYFFVLSRQLALDLNAQEVIWKQR